MACFERSGKNAAKVHRRRDTEKLWSAPSWWLWWRGYLHTVWVIISVVVDDTVPDNLLTTDTALLLTSLTWWWQRLCLEHLDFLLSNWFIVIHIMVWRPNLEYKSPWNTWRSTLDHPWRGICHQASFWNGNRARNVQVKIYEGKFTCSRGNGNIPCERPARKTNFIKCPRSSNMINGKLDIMATFPNAVQPSSVRSRLQWSHCSERHYGDFIDGYKSNSLEGLFTVLTARLPILAATSGSERSWKFQNSDLDSDSYPALRKTSSPS